MLEKLKAQNPYYTVGSAKQTPEISKYQWVAKAVAWNEGIQAAYDAGWRPVPTSKELRAILLGCLFKPEYADDLHQWLLERGK